MSAAIYDLTSPLRGESSLEHWITMKSTHGSLDRNNSLTFLLTMTDKQLPPALRAEDVMKLIEPNWQLRR